MKLSKDISATYICLLLCVLPLVIFLVSIYYFSVTVYFTDLITWAPMLERIFLDSDISIGMFFEQYEGNQPYRVPVPWAAHLVLIWLGKGNFLLTLLVQTVLIITNAFLFIMLCARSVKKLNWRWALCTLASCIILFSLKQWEAFLSPNGLTAHLHFLLMLGTLFVLQSPIHTKARIITAAILCSLLTFSPGPGMILWIAALPLIVFKPNILKQQKLLHCSIWLLFACITLWFFFHGLNTSFASASHETAKYSALLTFFFTVIGQTVFINTHQSFIAGIILFILSTIFIVWGLVVHHRNRPFVLLHLALYLCTIGAIAALTLVRGPNLVQATASRYVQFSNYILLLLVWLPILLSNRRIWLHISIVGIIAAFNIHASTLQPNNMYNMKVHTLQGDACLKTYTISSEACLKHTNFYGSKQSISQYAMSLEKLGYLQVFTVPPDAVIQRVQAGIYGDVEGWSQGSGWMAAPIDWKILQGWAVLPGCKPANHVVVTTGKGQAMIAHTRSLINRYDLHEVLNGCTKSIGWEIEIDDTTLAKLQGNRIDVWNYETKTNTLWYIGSRVIE